MLIPIVITSITAVVMTLIVVGALHIAGFIAVSPRRDSTDPRYAIVEKLQEQAAGLTNKAAKEYAAAFSHCGDKLSHQAQVLRDEAAGIMDDIREDELAKLELRKLEASPYPSNTSNAYPTSNAPKAYV